MSVDTVRHAGATTRPETIEAERPLVRSMLRGLICRCPRCGGGKLFAGYLRAVPACAACEEPYDGLHRADDLPPYLTVFVVGHLIVAWFMAVDEFMPLSLAASLGLFIPLTIVMSLALLRPMKGLTIGLQWSMRMHGFGRNDETGDH